MASRSTKEIRYAQPAVKQKPVMNAVRSVIAARKPAPQMASARAMAPITDKPQMRPNFTRTTRFVDNKGQLQGDPVDRNGNRLTRPKLGPADATTRRDFLDQALKPGPAVKPPSAPKTPPAQQYEGGGMGNKARRKVIDDTVDKMS